MERGIAPRWLGGRWPCSKKKLKPNRKKLRPNRRGMAAPSMEGNCAERSKLARGAGSQLAPDCALGRPLFYSMGMCASGPDHRPPANRYQSSGEGVQMRVEIKIFDDDNNVVAEQIGAATSPLGWKSPYEHPLIDGEYSIFAFSYQPVVTLKGKAGGF